MHLKLLNPIKKRWFSAILASFLCAVFYVYMSVSMANLIIFTAVIFGITLVCYNIVSIIKVEKILKKNYSRLLIGDCKLLISHHGISRKIGNSSISYEWSQFKQVSADDQMYFIYLSDTDAFPIKKIPDNMNAEETRAYNSLLKESIVYTDIKVKGEL